MRSVVDGFRAARCALLVLSVLWLGGCYTYRPVDRPAPGSTVRLQLPVVSALASPNAAPRSESVEGDVLSYGDEVVLSVQTRRMFGAVREVIVQDTLRLRPEQISSVEVREFSSGRSILLGVAIAGGVTALAVAGLGLAGGDDGDPGDPGPVAAVVVSDRTVVSAILRLLGGT